MKRLVGALNNTLRSLLLDWTSHHIWNLNMLFYWIRFYHEDLQCTIWNLDYSWSRSLLRVDESCYKFCVGVKNDKKKIWIVLNFTNLVKWNVKHCHVDASHLLSFVFWFDCIIKLKLLKNLRELKLLLSFRAFDWMAVNFIAVRQDKIFYFWKILTTFSFTKPSFIVWACSSNKTGIGHWS